MAKAYSSVWLVLVIITLALMVALYTRVVNALWCKQDNSPTNIQKVSAHKKKIILYIHVSLGPKPKAQSQKPKAQSPKPKAQSPKPKAQSPKPPHGENLNVSCP